MPISKHYCQGVMCSQHLKLLFSKIPSQSVVSDKPFIAPSARLSGGVEFPAEGEADTVVAKSKNKKKSRKNRKEDKDTKPRSSSPSTEKKWEQKEHSHTPAQSKPKPPPVWGVLSRSSLNIRRCILKPQHTLLHKTFLPVRKQFNPVLPVTMFLKLSLLPQALVMFRLPVLIGVYRNQTCRL